MKIAIVGMGVAGISILRELINQLENIHDHSITIYADEETFGTGLPYQMDDDSLILNQYTETMSMIPEEKLHFVQWVEKNKKIENPLEKYMPRSWYGEYLLELLKDLLQQSKATVIKKEVTAIRLAENDGYIITTVTGENQVDCVHLATGHLSYQDPYNLVGEDHYIHHPYPVVDKLKDIPTSAHVGILGTGLTAIDLMIFLKKIDPKMKLSMISFDGKFGSVRGPEKRGELNYFTKEKILSEKHKHKGIIPFNTIKQWFIKEIEKQGIDVKLFWNHYGLGTLNGLLFDLNHLKEIGKFQSVIQSMKDIFGEIWAALSEEGREQFLTEYAETFLRFRSPIPASSAKKIIEFNEKEQLAIYKDISDVKKNEKSFTISFKDNHPILEVDYVINGTGQSINLNKTRSLQRILIQQLINEHILLPYKHGGVQILFPNMSVISQKYGVLPSFKVYGQLVSGIDYQNNTVELISHSAVNGVKSMIQWMNEKRTNK